MKLAVYARVSTADHDQDPETQLHHLRSWAEHMGHEIVGEYVDYASANDWRKRTAWKRLIKDAASGQFFVVAATAHDRAWRSLLALRLQMEQWEVQGVRFISLRESFDTATAHGKLFVNMLGSFGEFESENTRERIHEGLARARAQGKILGRPRKTFSHAKAQRLLDAGLSYRKVAKELRVSHTLIAQFVNKT